LGAVIGEYQARMQGLNLGLSLALQAGHWRH